MKPFMIPGHRSNTPLVLVFLSVAGVLGGCRQESKIPMQPPRAVRLATVAAPQISGETLHYSASILPFAQVDLMFRSSGYVTSVRQVRGADGRTRDVGTGDYAEKNLTLAHIRREDLQNQVAQAQANSIKPWRNMPRPTRTSSERRPYIRRKVLLSQTTTSLRQLSMQLAPR